MKKMLMVATVPSMIASFNMKNIQILLDMGYEVHIACNFKDTSIWPKEKVKEFIGQLRELEVKYHNVCFSRSPKEICKVRKSFSQMNRLLKKEKFNFVHCHTPMAGVLSRISCHKNDVMVFYTAHGFHFYSGAPKINWLIYYPIEKLLSRWTDILITITHEDYRRARKEFDAKKTVYIPGVGIDIKKYLNIFIEQETKKEELGIDSNDVMLLSVGELNANKNHSVVIKALGELKKMETELASRIHYFIAGKGELHSELIKLAKLLGVNLHLLGFRNDVSELLKAADIFLLPSKREGLNVSLMEAMAGGLPCIVSDIRGNKELIENGKGGRRVESENIDAWKKEIYRLSIDKESRAIYGNYNVEIIKAFSDKEVSRRMQKIYTFAVSGE